MGAFDGKRGLRVQDASRRCSRKKARSTAGFLHWRLQPHWMEHSGLAPALRTEGLRVWLKLGGGATRGRLGGGGTIRGGRFRLEENPVCPAARSCSMPPEIIATCPSATVTYTPGGREPSTFEVGGPGGW